MATPPTWPAPSSTYAQDVLEDLTNTVVRSLAPPMQLSKLEGDAIFVYVPGTRVDASMLLDTLDAAYFAFRRRQDAIDRATQCDCNACVPIPRLDLKFVAHHGRFGQRLVFSTMTRMMARTMREAYDSLRNAVAAADPHTPPTG